MNENKLVILVKYPKPGDVKTRLGNQIGNKNAAIIYSAIAKYIVDIFSKSRIYKTYIFYDPPDKEKEIINWIGFSDLTYIPQVGGNLGEKIKNSFKHLFKIGAKKVIIIGTDCVDITNCLVEKCFTDYLNKFDTVIGPSEDGGYYLLGMKSYKPNIFMNIEWSTSSVLDQTLKKIKETNLNCKLLNYGKDIDYVEDLDKRSVNIIKNIYPEFSI